MTPTHVDVLRSELCAVLLLGLACASEALGQATPIPASGCADGVAIGAELFAVDNASPQIGSTTFAIEHLCEVSATDAFFLLGICNPPGPLPDWPTAFPCFAGWLNPPATCGNAIDFALPLTVAGGPVRTGKALLLLPIPAAPGLVGLELCVQFLCVDLTSATPCSNVSAGLRIVFEP